jgi:hypothetical protein
MAAVNAAQFKMFFILFVFISLSAGNTQVSWLTPTRCGIFLKRKRGQHPENKKWF